MQCHKYYVCLKQKTGLLYVVIFCLISVLLPPATPPLIIVPKKIPQLPLGI